MSREVRFRFAVNDTVPEDAIQAVVEQMTALDGKSRQYGLEEGEWVITEIKPGSSG